MKEYRFLTQGKRELEMVIGRELTEVEYELFKLNIKKSISKEIANLIAENVKNESKEIVIDLSRV